MKYIISYLLLLVAAIVAHRGYNFNYDYPQWGYFPQPNYPNFFLPPINYPLDNLWTPPMPFQTLGFGFLNPWGHHHRHHHFHHRFFPNHFFGAGYNFADKYAFDFFMKYGFNVKAALFFCNSFTTRPVVWQSAYLFNYCNYMNQNYGRGNKHIPTYPNVPENMPDQDVPSYPEQNQPSSYPEQSPPAEYPEQNSPSTYPEQSAPEQYPSQDGYPSNDAPQKLY
uniref:Uncharacterized protein n=1 Tax=Strongyloides papillosus TaxID=174720 RepID=A0A0N5CDR6_STREA